MTFVATVQDMLFSIEPSGADPGVAAAILEDLDGFCRDAIAPLKASGDREGSRCLDGQATTPKGFRDTCEKFVAIGWQGLPRAVAAAASEILNAARFAVGVRGVAIAERATQAAQADTRTRFQGRPVDGSALATVAIIQHPDLRRMLMQMRGKTEAFRELAAFAAGCEESSLADFLQPLVKGFCTEIAVQTTSTWVQILGGMEFIEETGAAQLCRDARTLPIHEGSTTILASDLLGRKTLRDNGATAAHIMATIVEAETALQDGPTVAQDNEVRLGSARHDLEVVVAHLLTTPAPDANGAAVPFLMLAENLVAGWQMARAVLVAERALAKGDDRDFMTTKIATARFYAQHMLPETALQRARALHGGESLLDAAL